MSNVLGNMVSGKGANRLCITPMLSSTDLTAPGMSAGWTIALEEGKWSSQTSCINLISNV